MTNIYLRCDGCHDSTYSTKEFVRLHELRLRAMRHGWTIGPGQQDTCPMCPAPSSNNHKTLLRVERDEAAQAHHIFNVGQESQR